MLKRSWTHKILIVTHMKNLLLILPLSLLTSCAYFHDRYRDACDMVTMGVEAPSAQASVQIGKSILGIGGANGKGFGLRSGAMGTYMTGEAHLILVGTKFLAPNESDLDRDKGYEYQYSWHPWNDGEKEFKFTVEDAAWFNNGQIEATLALGVGVRIGANPIELIDFILGIATLDICGDDIKTLEIKEKTLAEQLDNNKAIASPAMDIH